MSNTKSYEITFVDGKTLNFDSVTSVNAENGVYYIENLNGLVFSAPIDQIYCIKAF